MANSYYLQSAKDGLVFDIKTPVGSGSPLQAYEQKTEANQQWTFESVPGQAGYFYILSADQGLAVDIKTPVGSASPLQAYEQKTEANQWWQFKSVPGQAGYFHILSADQGLAVDIKTPVGSGSPLQAYEQKTEANQWWTFESAPGNTFNPKLNPPTTFVQLDPSVPPNSFVVSGTGFFPGRALTLSWLYAPQQGQGPDNTTATLTVTTDPTGAFDSANGLPVLSSTTGTLNISVTDTVTGQKVTESSYWNGTSWSS